YAVIYTVEFQKRGLPHIHCLLWLLGGHSETEACAIDAFICAEILDVAIDPLGYALVDEFMIHGPCGDYNRRCPCMKNDRCSKKFPKTYQDETVIDAFGYTLYRRRNNCRFIVKGGIKLDNRSVVPYNMQLLKKYNAHINVEWCNKTHMIKYLFKYVTKGSDRAKIYFELTANTTNASLGPQIAPPNEIREYIDAKYLSTCEALWRIFEFDIHFRIPSVERLSIHLPAKNIVQYEPGADLQALLLSRAAKKTMLTEWFEINLKYSDARHLTYCDFPKEWSWDASTRCWRRRRLTSAKIGRMYYVHPIAGELYYLRMLLMFVSGATSFVDVRTFQDIVYDTFREACEARGLLEGDNEWNLLFDEAIVSASAFQLRQLFVTIVVHCPVCNVRALFDKYWVYFTDDIHRGLREALGNPRYTAPHEQLLTLLSRKLADTFANSGANIADYDLPILSACGDEMFGNRLINDELRSEPLLLRDHAAAAVSQLNADQRLIFERLTESALSSSPGIFFVCGHGGTGKTFLWNAILTHLRSRQKIVLAVASSGVASLLLPKGRTALSHFKIPFDLDERGVCGVKRGTMLSELIQCTSLVIWDEAPMTRRHCFEALDRTMRDILSEHRAENANIPFGGKTIVLGGDFRQILPVVRKGSRSAIVNASITSSPLWQHATVLKLRTNMRLSNPSLHGKERADLEQFSKWVLDIGDGALPAMTRGDESEPTWVTIPEDLLIRTDGDAAAALISEFYPDLLERYMDPTYLATRAIVCPNNLTTDKINDYIVSMLPGHGVQCLSCDTISKASERIPDFDMLYLLGRRRRRHPSLEAFAAVVGPTETRQRVGTPFAPYDIRRRPATRSSHRAASSSTEAHV
ncbi:ATP-dependent DNA helicase pif1, partial [Zea mays]